MNTFTTNKLIAYVSKYEVEATELVFTHHIEPSVESHSLFNRIIIQLNVFKDKEATTAIRVFLCVVSQGPIVCETREITGPLIQCEPGGVSLNILPADDVRVFWLES